MSFNFTPFVIKCVLLLKHKSNFINQIKSINFNNCFFAVNYSLIVPFFRKINLSVKLFESKKQNLKNKRPDIILYEKQTV
ncbi:MAG: hypothetical protein DRQ43_00755 [Gammaproteobacteria bacterium]|nr:MAG: hypothetical protein DRQ43_00755 [Gammaproteobacteria bacterium]